MCRSTHAAAGERSDSWDSRRRQASKSRADLAVLHAGKRSLGAVPAAVAGGTAVVVAACGGGATRPPIRASRSPSSPASTPNTPISFSYPLQGQASVLVDVGEQVPEGVGPKKSIVAYSTCASTWDARSSTSPRCGSSSVPATSLAYDPERLGSIVQGVAMLPLPRVLLEVNGDSVDAVGMDGLIYGFRDNLKPGKEV